MSAKIDRWSSFLADLEESLGGYDPSPLIAGLIKSTLSNKDQGLILVDTQGCIAFMDRPTEKLFGLPPGAAAGRILCDFFPGSALPEVARSGVAQVGQVQIVKGKKKIVSRYPIIKDGQLIGAVGKVVFHELEEINKLALEIERLESKISKYKQSFTAKNSASYTFDNIRGTSKSIKETIKRSKRIAITGCTVLIVGESGTGKELFAHSIHQFSGRARGPFVKVNCAAIPFNLAESELFGYEKGAFTGGKNTGQIGKFELASGGTIFLDEICSMPLGIQSKLLRVIQEKEMQQLGSSNTKKVDFRLVAATNSDPQELVRKGSLRADLYYRLSSAPIYLDPLRERPEDIIFLAKTFLPDINQRLAGAVEFISHKALEVLSRYSFPGNVRELINILEQSILNAHGKTKIDSEDLPVFLHKSNVEQFPDGETLSHILAATERRVIHQTLQITKGNKKRAADLLGISRTALYQKLHRLA